MRIVMTVILYRTYLSFLNPCISNKAEILEGLINL
jgi:hypothetical protein